MVDRPAEGDVGTVYDDDLPDSAHVYHQGDQFHEHCRAGIAGSRNGTEQHVAGNEREIDGHHHPQRGDRRGDQRLVAGIDVQHEGWEEGHQGHDRKGGPIGHPDDSSLGLYNGILYTVLLSYVVCSRATTVYPLSYPSG